MPSSPPTIAARLSPSPLGGRRRALVPIAASAIATVAAAVAIGASGCDGDRRASGAGGKDGGAGGGTGTGGPIAWQWTVSCPGGREPTSPIDYGRCAIDQAL